MKKLIEWALIIAIGTGLAFVGLYLLLIFGIIYEIISDIVR